MASLAERLLIEGSELSPDKGELVIGNLGLAGSVAKQFLHRGKSYGIEYDDLFQIACIGLIKAANAYSPGRGKFGTYAVNVMQNEVRMELEKAPRFKKHVDLLRQKGYTVLKQQPPYRDDERVSGIVNNLIG